MVLRALLIMVILFWLNGANRIVAQDKVVLTGHTTAVQVLEEPTSVIVTVNLELTLRNESGANAILYWHDFNIVEDKLYRLDEKQNPEVLYLSSTFPSTNHSPTWVDLQNRLKTQNPPSELARILKSGESISFKRTTSMRLYRKGQFQASWSEILAASPLLLTVTLDMFPSNLDRTLASQESFAKKLQKKWRSLGVLQLEALRSEPIKLDLSKS